MPIDNALAELEDVSEELLKSYLVIPKTIEDLQEMYKNRFKITKSHIDPSWLKIISKNIMSDYTEYNFCLNSIEELGKPISKRSKAVFLKNWQNLTVKNGIRYNSDEGYFYWKDGHFYQSEELDEKTKAELKKWKEKSEKYILKQIPELEKFVENYNAN
jgi:hypothetical protein